MGNGDRIRRFEQLVLPHLDAAYNLARWITRNDHDADDVVNESFVRALRYFDGFHGTEARAWQLTIVRNTSYTWLKTNRPAEVVHGHEGDAPDIGTQDARNAACDARENDPETRLLQAADADLLNQAIAALPLEFREVLILRELQELSYKEIAEIAEIAGIPMGTVMSRLARGRSQLQRRLTRHPGKEHADGM